MDHTNSITSNNIKKPILITNFIKNDELEGGTSYINNEEIIYNTTIIDECPICFDLLDKTREVCTLECKHQFHLECLIDWYRRPHSNYKCPNCYVHRDIILIENTKNIVSKKNIKHQLYKSKDRKCIIS